MVYIRYLIPFSNVGVSGNGEAAKRFTEQLVSTVPNLSIYDVTVDRVGAYDAVLRITDTDYCYCRVDASTYPGYINFRFGIGPSVSNGTDSGNVQISSSDKFMEVVAADSLTFFVFAGNGVMFSGHLVSAVDGSDIEVYGFGGGTIRHPVSDSAYDNMSASIPPLGSAQLTVMAYGEYYLGEGVCYGNTEETAKAPWLHEGHGPYYIGGNPSPSRGVYKDALGNAFFSIGSNNYAWRIATAQSQ